MLASLFFVVIGLIEFACILFLHQYNEKNLVKADSPLARRAFQMNVAMMNMVSLSQHENGRIEYSNGKPAFDIIKIDRVAFVVVGVLFLIFNLLYWLTFMILDFN